MLIGEKLYHELKDSNGNTTVVFNDLTVSVSEGEIVALLGSSGCGKSTLLRILGGLVDPTRGRVMCQGKSVHQPESPIALVFQDYEGAVFPWITVRKNLE